MASDTRPMATFPATEHLCPVSSTRLYCFDDRRVCVCVCVCVCEQLPKVVIWKWNGWE